MFTNYIKIAWRNLINNKLFSLINVIGLTIGLSASFFIGSIIYYESTFEYFHPDKDRIYRVVTTVSSKNEVLHNSGVTLALKDAIKDNPNFEKLGSLFREQPVKVTVPETQATYDIPKFVIYAEQDYFDIFQYTFLAGNSEHPIDKPNTVVLTEERAKRYFPNLTYDQIIGQTLIYDAVEVIITGIVQSFPNRSDIIFQEFISWPTLLQTSRRTYIQEKRWNSTTSDSQLFVKLPPNADLEAIQALFDKLAAENADERAVRFDYKRKIQLQPLLDMHFNENYGVFYWEDSRINKSILTNFGLIAAFLLLLGCINFINLNTAQATQRAKEIGIRKTLGSSRQQLIWQFIGETFLLVLISAVISFVLTDWLLDVFSEFVPEGLGFEALTYPAIIQGILLLIICITFLAGFYPALLLSNLSPVKILNQKFITGHKKAKLRKVLTVFQFTIALIFIIGTLLVGKQVNFMLSKDMGFNTESTVSVYQPFSVSDFSKLELLANQLKENENIEAVSICNNPPASITTVFSEVTRKLDSSAVSKPIRLLHGDTNYTDVFDINLVAGEKRESDTIREVLINQKALADLGFQSPDKAVGKTLEFNDKSIKIVGVMEDFHQSSFHLPIEPIVLAGDWYRPRFYQYQMISMKIKPLETIPVSEVINQVKEQYNQVYPNTEIKLEFMDSTIQGFYDREEKVSKLLKWASGLSVLISSLGLLGLVIFTTNRRVKEIGIRKVVGASVFEIYMLLCKEFIVLIGLSFLIAAPITYYAINQWLEIYTYKIDIDLWSFVIGGLLMMVFSLIVMSVKTLNVATSNPVKALKAE